MDLDNSFLHSGRLGVARLHPDGFRVVMFHDDLGTFYTELGDKLSDKEAGEAGFDVGHLSIERTKRERLAEAKRKIDEQFSKEADRITKDVAAADVTRDDEEEAALVRIDRVARGSFNVRETATNRILLEGVSRVQAEAYVVAVNARGEVFDPGDTVVV
jgi:hypothetical protein